MGKTPCTKAVAYVRASTGGQIISPEDQREKIQDYCKMAGLQLVETIVERAVSAKIRLSKRPEGARVQALLDGGVCHIVALKLDRLFRNAGDALTTIDAWEEAGVHLHLVDMGGTSINTGSSIGKMILTMLAGFAAFERDIISERTSAALQFQKAHGKAYTRSVYGFDAVGGELVVNTREARVLDRMRARRAEFELYTDKEGVRCERHTSYHQIADELNADGVPAKNGGVWHPFAVQKVLANRVMSRATAIKAGRR